MVMEAAAARGVLVVHHGVRLLPALDPALLPCKEPELLVQVQVVQGLVLVQM